MANLTDKLDFLPFAHALNFFLILILILFYLPLNNYKKYRKRRKKKWRGDLTETIGAYERLGLLKL